MLIMPFFYTYDIYYFILVIPAFILSLAVQIYLKTVYRKMSSVGSSTGITGAQAAANVLSHHGLSVEAIEPVRGTLSDHYDPRTKVIRLSRDVYYGTSIAAIGIACHEAGHAVQYGEQYFPIKFRNSILPLTRIGSTLGIPLAIFGLIIEATPLVYFGLILYAFVALFQFATLPVELNASKRAMQTIDATGMLVGVEKDGAKKVLTAAALTYVAALAVSVANLLRLLLRFRSRD